MLTARQIEEKGIIYVSPQYSDKVEYAPAQVGIDLHIVKVDKLKKGGLIPREGKTVLGPTKPVPPKKGKWKLRPGVYEIQLAEGCKFDAYTCGKITHRSSCYRNGVEIESPWFDPGFETDSMGTFMEVKVPVTIECFARVAQIAVFTTEEAAELYNGQFQNDKQRKSKKKEGK